MISLGVLKAQGSICVNWRTKLANERFELDTANDAIITSTLAIHKSSEA